VKPIRTIAFALATVSLAATAWAAPSGFAFLQVPAGARAAAMGGAYLSIAQGAEAAFWNPAGLADFTGTQFTATHIETYEHLRHEQVAVAGRLFGGGMAASLRAMYSEPIPERDELGNLIGSFGSHDLEFLLGYGRTIGGVAFGASAQHVRERIADQAAGTWAMNAGASWRMPALAGARVSVSLHQLGGSAHYTFNGAKGQPVPLPTMVAAGLAWQRPALRGLTARLAVEAHATRGRAGLYAFGGELEAPIGASLRAGFRVGDDIADWSVGAGWRAGVLQVDYAFVPSKLALDDTHRFSLGAHFSSAPRPRQSRAGHVRSVRCPSLSSA
jgi:hypothetical protein